MKANKHNCTNTIITFRHSMSYLEIGRCILYMVCLEIYKNRNKRAKFKVDHQFNTNIYTYSRPKSDATVAARYK